METAKEITVFFDPHGRWAFPYVHLLATGWMWNKEWVYFFDGKELSAQYPAKDIRGIQRGWVTPQK